MGFPKPLFNCRETMDIYAKAIFTTQCRWEVEGLLFWMSCVVEGRRWWSEMRWEIGGRGWRGQDAIKVGPKPRHENSLQLAETMQMFEQCSVALLQ